MGGRRRNEEDEVASLLQFHAHRIYRTREEEKTSTMVLYATRIIAQWKKELDLYRNYSRWDDHSLKRPRTSHHGVRLRRVSLGLRRARGTPPASQQQGKAPLRKCPVATYRGPLRWSDACDSDVTFWVGKVGSDPSHDMADAARKR